MPTAVLTPFTGSRAVELASQWWKKLLPVGDVEYRGRTLKFTRDYLAGLKQAFDDRAYDQVPFQLADSHNTHTNDPERTRGEIAEMDVRGDGLWVRLDPTSQGGAVLAANPKLGVSARIVEDYARSDGKHYPAAIQHVLGTLDPRIPGLGPWQAIEAAGSADDVIDLSGAVFAGETEAAMDLDPDKAARLARLLEVDPARFDTFLASLEDPAGGPPITDEDLAALTAPPEQEQEPDVDLTDDELAEIIAVMPPEEFEALMGDFQAETASTGLTAEAQMQIDLATAQADEASRSMAVLQKQLDASAFEQEKRRLADAGIPPFIAELAKPLLEGTGHAVELSNGGRADAGAVMRQVLDAVGKTTQMLDLGVELGSPFDEPAGAVADEKAASRESVIERYKSQTGLR